MNYTVANEAVGLKLKGYIIDDAYRAKRNLMLHNTYNCNMEFEKYNSSQASNCKRRNRKFKHKYFVN